MGEKSEIGRRGEAAAVKWLGSNGFAICHTNWRNGRYELDIVAEKEGVIHFVEVKCRREGGLTAPEDAITPSKFGFLRRAARAYIAAHGLDCHVQFDLVAVEYSGDRCRIRYVPEAMQQGW